jgi:hypothetical protein
VCVCGGGGGEGVLSGGIEASESSSDGVFGGLR